MPGLILRERFDFAVAPDPDADRNGVVTREAGVLNPNHLLGSDHVPVRRRAGLPARTGVGKTLVSSSIIDLVCADLDRPLLGPVRAARGRPTRTGSSSACSPPR